MAKQTAQPAPAEPTPVVPATSSGQELVNALNATQAPEPVAENTEPAPAQTPTPATGDVAHVPHEEPKPAEQPPEFVAKLRELGFQDVNDEAEGRERLAAAYRQQQEQAEQLRQEMEQLRQYAALGQQYASQLQDPAYQQFQAQRQQPKQETQQQPDRWWSPPEFKPEVAQRYRETKVGPDGQPYIDWKANTPVEVKQSYDQYQKYVEDWSYDLVNRPHEVLPRIIQQEAQKIVSQMIEERFGEVQQKTELERLTEEIRTEAPWVYRVDPVTNSLTDQFSEAGQRVLERIKQAQEAGMTDPRMQWEYARNAVVVEQLLQQQQYQQQPAASNVAQVPHQQPAPPVAAPTPAQRNAEYLQRQAKAASSRPSRNGATQTSSAEESGQRPGRRRSPGHDFLEELQRAGVSV